MTTRRHALFVGAEQYSSFINTEYCHADVDLLSETLVTFCDYPATSVTTLKLEPGDGISPSDILRHVETLVTSAAHGDTLLFYFAGHGHLVGGVPYLVLPDSSSGDWARTAVALSDISDLLRRDKVNCFRIFDACHSGKDVRDGGYEWLDSSGFMRAALTPGQGWAIFAACSADEMSYSDPTKGNGIFTHFLSECLRKFSPEQPVYLEQIKIDVCNKVDAWAKARNYQQRPTLNAALVGNVPIAVRSKPAVKSSSLDQVSTQPGPVRQRDTLEFSERLAAARNLQRITCSDDNEHTLKTLIASFRESPPPRRPPGVARRDARGTH